MENVFARQSVFLSSQFLKNAHNCLLARNRESNQFEMDAIVAKRLAAGEYVRSPIAAPARKRSEVPGVDRVMGIAHLVSICCPLSVIL